MNANIAEYNPGPEFFREAAVAAAKGQKTNRGVPIGARYWCEQKLGVPRNKGLFGFGDYRAPNHHRVITFLWLELLARK